MRSVRHQNRLSVAFLFLCLCITLATGVRPAQAQVEAIGVRFGIQGDNTRIVLDLDQRIEFDVKVVQSPDQLIVELPHLRWRLQPSPLDQPRGLAVSKRFGRFDKNQDRLVIDLNKPIEIKRAMLLPPRDGVAHYRLVVDIAASSSSPATYAKPTSKPEPPKNTSTAKVAKSWPKPLSRPQIEENAIAAKPTPRTVDQNQISTKRKPMIVLDPGHGGVDPGAVGINGVYEKHIVLEMAEELAELLRETGRYDVTLTRHTDVFLPLSERLEASREVGADLFISIHADSIHRQNVRGASVYTLSEKASDSEAAKLASKENKADILGGVDLSTRDETVARILIDLAQRDTNNKSIEFANKLIKELAASTRVLKRTRRFAGFFVLKSPETPSVLLEMGYLSNPDDAQDLKRPEHRADIGHAIVRGIDRYFDDVKHALALD